MSAQTASNNSNKPLSVNPTHVGDVWDNRYQAEGEIWGEFESPAAHVLSENDSLNGGSHILEIGFGYGRDLKYFLDRQHFVTGIEIALEGLRRATKKVDDAIKQGRAHLNYGNFATARITPNSMDAVFSHRVIHLLGRNGLVQEFAKASARALKPEGLLVVSARSPKDFNESRMRWVDEKDLVAEYKDRSGHLIAFWDEARFRSVFGGRFKDMEFQETTEREAGEGSEMSHLIIMTARKKSVSEFSQNP